MFKRSFGLCLLSALLISTTAYSHDHRAIVGYKTVLRTEHHCWKETGHPRHKNYTGAIIGGVAGGLLGSTVGGGNGRVAATAVGAGTGAIVGDSIVRKREHHTVRHCSVVKKRVRVPIYSSRTVHTD